MDHDLAEPALRVGRVGSRLGPRVKGGPKTLKPGAPAPNIQIQCITLTYCIYTTCLGNSEAIRNASSMDHVTSTSASS